MRIVWWALMVLFVVVLGMTSLLCGGWLMAVADASEGGSFSGLGQGFGDAFAGLVATLMLWCLARSARETAEARSAVPGRLHHAR
jgi:hypothetical protein